MVPYNAQEKNTSKLTLDKRNIERCVYVKGLDDSFRKSPFRFLPFSRAALVWVKLRSENSS